jgi:Zn-dependent membrane protease YugP
MGFLLVFFAVPVVLGLVTQSWVKNTFARASQVQSASGMTGEQVSRALLDAGGLSGVGIEHINGELNDHYDPRAKVMRLSSSVGHSSSIGAIAVAAHETGHAFQDAKHELTFRFRSALVPAASFASNAWMFVLVLGAWTASMQLVAISVAIFSAVVLFSLVTLPVEFGASRKAMRMLVAQGILTPSEAPVARKVLTAAAMTYVAAALAAIIQLAFLLMRARQ